MTPMSERTLRCANGSLYMLMGCCVAGCVVFAGCSGRWAWWYVVAVGALGLAWGAYYGTLRWRVDSEGVETACLGRRRRYAWQQLAHAECASGDQAGVGYCRIVLKFREGEVRLSSELIDLEEVEKLRDELISAGILAGEAAAHEEAAVK